MSIKVFTIGLTLGLLIFLNINSEVQGRTFYESVAGACKWLKENVGYGCDGASERWIWRNYMWYRYGVTDCNSFCQKYHGRASGQCNHTGNYDTSTWCPTGQTCVCQ